MSYRYNIEILKPIIEKSFSYAQILRELEIIPAGGNYKTIKNFIKENKIDISHFTGKIWNKGRKSVSKRDTEDYLNNKYKINSNDLKYRLIKENIKQYKCENCGLDKWLDRPIPIELDHIDGDHNNNSLENLKILCSNCHAQTDTYRGRNIKIREKRQGMMLLKNKKDNKHLILIQKEKEIKIYGYCIVCKKTILKRNIKKYCSLFCTYEGQKKIKLFDEEFVKLLEENNYNYSAVGRIFNVSSNAIKKHYKKILLK